MDESDLRKSIALLKWDLQSINNQEVRDVKEKQLKIKEEELKDLLSKIAPGM